jgi:hypothetical protein
VATFSLNNIPDITGELSPSAYDAAFRATWDTTGHMDSLFDQGGAGLVAEEERIGMTQGPSGGVDLMVDFNQADMDLALSTNDEEEVTEEVYTQPSACRPSEVVPLASISEEA